MENTGRNCEMIRRIRYTGPENGDLPGQQPVAAGSIVGIAAVIIPAKVYYMYEKVSVQGFG